MVRHPTPEVVAASRKFVCVRIVDMRGVDLSTYEFDYGLTLAVLLMHPDGHIYHQYGNRLPDSAESRLSMTSLLAVMKGTLEEHGAFVVSGASRPESDAVSVEQLPTMARRVAEGKAPECYHCHMVNQAHDEEAIEAGTFDETVAWRWPPSTRVGLQLDADDQHLVIGVVDGSPAAGAGIASGDRVVSVAERSVRTEGDVQWALHDVPASGGVVPVTVLRGDDELTVSLELDDGWRVGRPEELWRSTMWRLNPRPGFGGPMLTPEEKSERGIEPEVSAFPVKYLVTWGEFGHTGKNAAAAGIQKGDVVLSVDGKSDFHSTHHFHAWFRLEREVGQTVTFEILRDDERVTVEMPVVE